MMPELFDRISGGRPLFVTSLPDTPGGGFIKSAFVDSAAAVEQFIAKFDKPTQSTYYCVSQLSPAADRRKENVETISCLWADIDFRAHPNLTPGEVSRGLSRCRLLPTRVVDTGGGFHAYWDLREPFDVTGDEKSRGLIEQTLKLLADFVGGDRSVCEVARLMRLPGSHNTKHGDSHEVRVIAERPSGYDLEEIIDWVTTDAPVLPPLSPRGASTKPRANGRDTSPDAYSAFAAAQGADRERLNAEAALEAMKYRHKTNGIHNTQIRVALSLLQAGIPVDEIVERLLTATRRAAGAAGLKWDWDHEEEIEIRRGALGSAFKKLCQEYDSSTGLVPDWVPHEMRPRWTEIIEAGGTPRIQPLSRYRGFFLRDISAVVEALHRGREARNEATRQRAEPPPKDEPAGAGSAPPDSHPPQDDPPENRPADGEPVFNAPPPKGGFTLSSGQLFNPPPYAGRDPAKLPRRQWLYGKDYLRGVVSASVGAPGRLKSTTTQTEALAMVVKRDLIHGRADEEFGELRVAYLNGEETQDELDRRHAAICQYYGIKEEMYRGRLWVWSTRDNPIYVAEPSPKGQATINQTNVKGLAKWCDGNAIDVLVIDPLISFHRVRENSNGDMDLVVKQGFAKVAGNSRAVELVHHPRKSAPGEVNTTVEDMRGASATLAAVRTARVFNFMTETEASQLGIDEDVRRQYVRIEGGKGGPGPLGKARWVKIEVEHLANGDDVAVAVKWRPPDSFISVDPVHTCAVIADANRDVQRAA